MQVVGCWGGSEALPLVLQLTSPEARAAQRSAEQAHLRRRHQRLVDRLLLAAGLGMASMTPLPTSRQHLVRAGLRLFRAMR